MIAPVNVTTPGWPEKYPNNADCRWLVTARPGYKVSGV